MLPILVGVLLVIGIVVYFAVADEQTYRDPYFGLTTEVPTNLDAERQAKYEAEVIDLTMQIETREAAGEYVLDVYFNRAADYQRLGKLRLAFEDFEKVVAGDSTNETAWNNMGDIRIDMGDIDGAEQYYKNSIREYPTEMSYTKLYKYYLEYRMDDRQNALEPLLLEAIKTVGPTPLLYVKLGRFYIEAGDRDKAVAAYRQAAVLDPDNEAIKEELREALAM